MYSVVGNDVSIGCRVLPGLLYVTSAEMGSKGINLTATAQFPVAQDSHSRHTGDLMSMHSQLTHHWEQPQ